MPKQSIPIELGGKTRHLRFTFNSFVTLEQALDRPISEIGEILSGSVSAKNIRTLVWAGLIHEDSGLTEEQVGDWLEFDMLTDIAQKLAEAFDAAFPGAGDEKNGKSSRGKSD